jgi:hypothetical protein
MKKRINLIKFLIYTFTIISLLLGCKTSVLLPSIKYNQYEFGISLNYNKDTLNIKLNNPLHCPLRVLFFSSDEQLQKEFNKRNPITINSVSDTILTFVNIQKKDNEIRIISKLGDASKKLILLNLNYHFLKIKNSKFFKVAIPISHIIQIGLGTLWILTLKQMTPFVRQQMGLWLEL